MPDRDRPNEVEFLTGWLHTYLTNPSLEGMPLYDFAQAAGGHPDTTAEEVLRHLLFGLGRAVGHGVTLFAVPSKTLLGRLLGLVG